MRDKLLHFHGWFGFVDGISTADFPPKLECCAILCCASQKTANKWLTHHKCTCVVSQNICSYLWMICMYDTMAAGCSYPLRYSSYIISCIIIISMLIWNSLLWLFADDFKGIILQRLLFCANIKDFPIWIREMYDNTISCLVWQRSRASFF